MAQAKWVQWHSSGGGGGNYTKLGEAAAIGDKNKDKEQEQGLVGGKKNALNVKTVARVRFHAHTCLLACITLH